MIKTIIDIFTGNNNWLGDILPVKKLSSEAQLPTRNNTTDAGLDLYASEDKEIKDQCGEMIKTDIAIKLPMNTVGLICDRSGMGKKGFKVHGGVVDDTYRGSVNVILWNHSGQTQTVKKGDRIGQLLVVPLLFPRPVEVSELDETERGEKGFGSSGK